MEKAWEFFATPRNLPCITPPWLDFTIASELPERMLSGAMMTYRVRPFFGLPVTWVSEITHLEPKVEFVDEQRRGPYRFWHHRHRFEPVAAGVEMTDEVHYALHFGPLGELVHAMLVKKRLTEIFDFRRAVLAQLFRRRPGGQGPAPGLHARSQRRAAARIGTSMT